MAVVLGRLDADVMKRRSIAQIVLRSVGVGVEHILGIADELRLRSLIAEEIVKIGVHAE